MGFLNGTLRNTQGNSSQPMAGGLRYIVQIVDDSGEYSGDAALSARWGKVKETYRHDYLKKHGKLKLGSNQQVQVQSDTIVVNMIACADGKVTPEDFKACLVELEKLATYDKGSIHINEVSGESWEGLLEIIKEELIEKGLNVTTYFDSK